jgi:hypothetical protein
LVDALNATGMVQTFSSCEGHYEPVDQTLVDRNHAYVRFIPATGISAAQVEITLGQWLVSYKNWYGLLPVRVTGYKLLTPLDDEIDSTFVLEIHPFNRFDSPAQKRADTDRAIQKLVSLVSM